jgi:hypothetical protein
MNGFGGVGVAIAAAAREIRALKRRRRPGILSLVEPLVAFRGGGVVEELAEAALPITGTMKDFGNGEKEELVS